MEILVCIKQVPDDSVEIKINADTNKPAIDGITPVVNAFDTYALEMATRFKEANGGEITVLCIGPDEAKNGLKNCLAVGANKAFLVSDKELPELGTLSTSYVIEKAMKKIEEVNGKKFDIVFCGKETTDCTSGQVGAELSELLNVGLITNIIEIDEIPSGIKTKQETEEGYNVIETAIPCVVTVTKPNYDPRYPTIKNKMAARKTPITELSTSELGLDDEKVKNYVKVVKEYEPPKREAGIKIQEETCADSALKAIAIMAEAKVI